MGSAAEKRPRSSPGNALRAARLALGLLKDRFASKEAELAFMNGEYLKLKEKHEEAVKWSMEFDAVDAARKKLEVEKVKLEKRLEDSALDLKAEQDFTKREQVARDEWKAFALGLVVQLIAIDSVVKDAPGDEAAAVRQLVLGAKKIPHPAPDPMHPNIWKWAILSPALMVGAAAYFLYKSLGGPAGAAK